MELCRKPVEALHPGWIAGAFLNLHGEILEHFLKLGKVATPPPPSLPTHRQRPDDRLTNCY